MEWSGQVLTEGQEADRWSPLLIGQTENLDKRVQRSSENKVLCVFKDFLQCFCGFGKPVVLFLALSKRTVVCAASGGLETQTRVLVIPASVCDIYRSQSAVHQSLE